MNIYFLFSFLIHVILKFVVGAGKGGRNPWCGLSGRVGAPTECHNVFFFFFFLCYSLFYYYYY